MPAMFLITSSGILSQMQIFCLGQEVVLHISSGDPGTKPAKRSGGHNHCQQHLCRTASYSPLHCEETKPGLATSTSLTLLTLFDQISILIDVDRADPCRPCFGFGNTEAAAL